MYMYLYIYNTSIYIISLSKTLFHLIHNNNKKGLKTCAIADLLSNNKLILKEYPNLKDIRVVGVDISEQRIQLCKNIIKKYHIDKATNGGNGSEQQNQPKSENDKKIISSSNIKPRIRLYCTDGTTFGTEKIDPSSLFFDSDIAIEEEDQKGKRKRMNKSARARQKKKLRTLVSEEEEQRLHELETKHDEQEQRSTRKPQCNENQKIASIQLFDRVLVDAECSTDGAVRHLQHRHKKSSQTSRQDDNKYDYAHNFKLTDANKLADLVDLQKRLIESGFRLLKPGGVLVYSTCSLAAEQNEEVVSWLLQLYNKDAFIIPVSFTEDSLEESKSKHMMIYEGSLKGTVRSHPNVSMQEEGEPSTGQQTDATIDHFLFGGGFFLAKIGKRLY